ncbi:MAG: zinc-dependent alcohol dehydrogenase family protein [Planctomycetes bacterium]|nr:zinc-dependent alcohol dehydrogenase family protein [Planctomycetota bacterium]
MKAMLLTKFGGPEVLQPGELPEPVPGEHDLLVEVHACSINPVDFKMRRGAFGKGRTLPYALGFDVSGVVRAVGVSVKAFKVGDEVYASPTFTRHGANAELVCVDARTAALKPANLDYVQAAALPLVTLSAWESLYDRGRIEAGQTVLIHAGGGGVGHIAIQLARLRGCRVLTTAGRPESIGLCRSLGADVVINYHEEDFAQRVMRETSGRGCDAILDCVGFETLDKSLPCVAPNGQVMTVVGGAAGALRELFVRNATLHCVFMAAPTLYGINPERQGRTLAAAARLVESGKLRVHVGRVLGLAELPEAHRLIESGHTTGKIVLRVK